MLQEVNDPVQLKIKDSGVRETFDTGAKRDVQEGKGRYDLLPCHAIYRLALTFEKGSKKYGDRNWEKGMPVARFLCSGIRHAFQYLAGKRDEDHLAQAAWNLMCAIEIENWVREGKLPTDLLLDKDREQLKEKVIIKNRDSSVISQTTHDKVQEVTRLICEAEARKKAEKDCAVPEKRITPELEQSMIDKIRDIAIQEIAAEREREKADIERIKRIFTAVDSDNKFPPAAGRPYPEGAKPGFINPGPSPYDLSKIRH